MGLVSALQRAVRSWPTWMNQDPAFRPILDLDSDRGNSSGVMVNQVTALGYSAVWDAVNMIANAIASLPLVPYRAQEDGTRSRLDKTQLFWLVHEEPNGYMTPFTFYQTLIHHVLFGGNFYAEIQKDGSGRPVRLLPAEPNSIRGELKGGTIVYHVSEMRAVPADGMIHVPGLSWDGVRGYSPITKARESIGLGLATENFGASFFGRGAWPGVTLEHPGTLSAPAAERIEASWNKQLRGKPFGTKVLEEGMKANKIGISPEDSQFLETRQFQVEEIARWFQIPLHKLKSKAGERPGGNVEAQNIEFVVDCLRPWLVRIEQEFTRKLVPYRERPAVYLEYTVDALLRGDSVAEAQSFKAYFDMGVVDADFIAKKKNFPKPPEPKPAPAADPAEPPPPDEAKAAKEAMRGVVLDTISRMARIESNEARQAAARGPEKFVQWREAFYPKHRVRLEEALLPVVRLAGPISDWRKRAEELAGQMAARSEGELEGLDVRLVDALARRWEIERPAEVAAEILGGN